jgi:hypothetical protein
LRSGDESTSAAGLQSIVDALGTAATALDIAFETAPFALAHELLTRLIETEDQPSEAARVGADALARRVSDSLVRIRRTLVGVPCPPLADMTEATLDDACHFEDVGDSPMSALRAVEALHTRLLLEVCWLARRGEAIAEGRV